MDNPESGGNKYIEILRWAYEKRVDGFSEEELFKKFGINNTALKDWYLRTFRGAASNDDCLISVFHSNGVVRCGLSAKGQAAAIDFLNLEAAKRSAKRSECAAFVAIVISIITAWLQINSNRLTSDSLELTAEPVISIQYDASKISPKPDEVSVASGFYLGENGKMDFKIINHSVSKIEDLNIRMSIWEVYKRTDEPLTVCPLGYVGQVDESNFYIADLLTSNVLRLNDVELRKGESHSFSLNYGLLKDMKLTASSSHILLKMDLDFTKHISQTRDYYIKLFEVWPHVDTLVDIDINPTTFGILDKRQAKADQLPPSVYPFQQEEFLRFFDVLTPELNLIPGACTEFFIEKQERVLSY